MRIAIVSTMGGSPWGGSEELWALCAQRALEGGHTVQVSVLRWRPRAGRVDELARAGAGVDERFNSRIEAVFSRLPVVFPFRFRRVRAFRPDVVLISMGGAHDVGLYGVTRELRTWLLEAGAPPYVLLAQSNPEEPLPADRMRVLSAETYRAAARALFVSDRNRRACERQLGVHLPQARVVCNPVAMANLDEVPWPAQAEPSLAVVGRLFTVHKGQDVLLEALSDRAWRQREWRLRLFGSGPDEGYIRRLIEMYGLTSHVMLAGHGKVRDIWAQHHALLLPSRTEGTPLAMIEAMLCGRPALVSDVAGNAEWTFERPPPGKDRWGQTGWVAGMASAEQLAPALERMWAQRDRWQEIGRAARAFAQAHYEPDPGAALLGHVLEAANTHGKVAAPGGDGARA